MGGETPFDKTARDFGNHILGIVVAIGVAVALVMIIANGIKYMTGSTADKADIKKHIIVYMFGAILLFAGGTIVYIMAQFFENI